MEEREQSLEKLVDQCILSLRTFCRKYNNQPLWGIYAIIYDKLRARLISKVKSQVKCDRKTNRREYFQSLLVEASREVLDDNLIKQLALKAQKLPPGKLKQYALRELIEAISVSGKLARPLRKEFPSDFYELLYEEAVSKTLTYVCEKIATYQPMNEEGKSNKFMNWVNFRLEKEIIETRRDFSWMDKLKWKEKKNPKIPSLQDIEEMAVPTKETSEVDLRQLLKQTIEEDRKGIYGGRHIRGKPKANFQVIALGIASGKTYTQLGKELGCDRQTISSFFNKCCRELMEHFQEELGI